MADIYSKEQFFKLTQGSIITNCVCSFGDSIDVWGFIITARCDCANENKVDEIYYIPIVNFGDWFLLYEKDRCINAWKKERQTHLSEKLNKINKSNIKDYTIFSQSEIEKMLDGVNEKIREEIQALYTELSGDCNKNFLTYIKGLKSFKHSKQDIERLTRNEENNFIIIPDWQPLRTGKHKIIMLREIKRLKSNIALSFEDPRFMISDVPNFTQSENDIRINNPNNIYCIDKQMLSPHVEFVMQRFANNFTRIGIDRFPTVTTENLLKEIQEIV